MMNSLFERFDERKKKEMYEMLMNAKLNPVETVRHGLSNDKLISLPYVIRGNQLTKF